MIENEKFDDMMLDAAVYVDGFVDESVQRYNALMQVGRTKLKSAHNDSLLHCCLERCQLFFRLAYRIP